MGTIEIVTGLLALVAVAIGLNAHRKKKDDTEVQTIAVCKEKHRRIDERLDDLHDLICQVKQDVNKLSEKVSNGMANTIAEKVVDIMRHKK